MDALKRIVDGAMAAVPVATATADSAYKRGRLAMLSKVLGRIDETVDPNFCTRKRAADEVERIQVEMHRRFERVVTALQQLGTELEGVAQLVTDFHRSIDALSADPHDAVSADAQRKEQLAENLKLDAAKLTHLARSAGDTLHSSCSPIIANSLSVLRTDGANARALVRASQVEVDLARADAATAADYANTAETAFEQLLATGGTSKTMEASRNDLEAARRNANVRESIAESRILSYRECLSSCTTKLDFALEQVSMATWSCFNVFYTEIGNVFRDGTPTVDSISRAIKDLKNLQAIAKQLTRERQDRLAREREAGELRLASSRAQFVDANSVVVSAARVTSTSPDEFGRPAVAARQIEWEDMFLREPAVSSGCNATHHANNAAEAPLRSTPALDDPFADPSVWLTNATTHAHHGPTTSQRLGREAAHHSTAEGRSGATTVAIAFEDIFGP